MDNQNNNSGTFGNLFKNPPQQPAPPTVQEGLNQVPAVDPSRKEGLSSSDTGGMEESTFTDNQFKRPAAAESQVMNSMPREQADTPKTFRADEKKAKPAKKSPAKAVKKAAKKSAPKKKAAKKVKPAKRKAPKAAKRSKKNARSKMPKRGATKKAKKMKRAPKKAKKGSAKRSKPTKKNKKKGRRR